MRYLLATVGVVFLLVVGIVIFTRSGSRDATTPNNNRITVTDYTDNPNASVQYTIQGPINAAENHRQVRITISPNSRQIDVIKGYQGEVINSATYGNDSGAYGNFLEALNRANFTKERRIEQGVNSEAICPLGNRTYYQIVEDNEDVMNLWNASCVAGTFGGNVTLTQQLFQLQIPDYNKITSGVNVTGNSTGGTGLVL